MDAIKEPDELKKKVDECHGVVEVTYPIEVKYCGNCSMPIEYCEYYAEYDKCKEWLAKNYPEDYEKLMLREAEADAGAAAGGMDSDRKRQKRGGKGMLRVKKDNEDDNEPKRVRLSCSTRGKNKRVTLVAGLAAFKIDLRAAAKFFGTKFACGSSVSGDKEIVIQGDVKDDLLKVIPDKWPEVTRDAIEDCGESKK
ncbi:PREDICTED: density-regulated protein homolog [Drosophila arizonae]|uniref:Density-regulated protein homolog n=1 Tax=Drosophila arizonae TaxID=7263 RepID=A0ABM1NKS7_DROAR|nr:PREDICTED: density-regulated protein homolog [Drosophila arizonae]